MKILFLFLLIHSSSPSRAAGIDCFESQKIALLPKKFYTHRSLRDYRLMFGNDLSRSLGDLPKAGHVLELGGGDGNAARDISEKGYRVTLVAYSANDPVPPRQNLKTIRGIFFEDIPLSDMLEFGEVQLALDPWGVLAYTTRINLALQRIHSLLAPHGKVLFLVGPEYPKTIVKIDASGNQIRRAKSSVYSSEVVLKNGEAFSLPALEYLGNSTDPELFPRFIRSPNPNQQPPARLFKEVD